MKANIFLFILQLLFFIPRAEIQDLDKFLIHQHKQFFPTNKFQLKAKISEVKPDLSTTLRIVFQNWDKLKPKTKALYFELKSSAIDFSGTRQIYNTKHFRLHYTTDGSPSESVPSSDKDLNGVPDYIDRAAKILEEDIYTKYHNKHHYFVPPPDSLGLKLDTTITGGSAHYDIYFSSLKTGITYGYVNPLHLLFKNNPNSNLSNVSNTSYMVLRSNFSEENDYLQLRATLAHEYMHAIQFGYSAYSTNWFSEMFATWAEDLIYPNAGENYPYLPTLINNMDTPLNINIDDKNAPKSKWYGTWLFARYMTEQTDDSIVKQIYMESALKNLDEPDMEIKAFDNILKAHYQYSFGQLFNDFLISLVLMSNSQFYAPYIFNFAPKYKNYLNSSNKDTKLYSSDIQTDSIKIWDSKLDGDGELYRISADFHQIGSSNDSLHIKIKKDKNPEISLTLLKFNEDEVEVVQADSHLIISDLNEWEHKVLIVKRADYYGYHFDSKDYQLQVYTNPKYLKNYTNPSTGIDNKDIRSIKIGPNPCSNFLNIYNLQPFSTLSIYRTSGEKTYSELNRNTTHSIDCSQFTTGNYILKIDHKKRSKIFKFTIYHD